MDKDRKSGPKPEEDEVEDEEQILTLQDEEGVEHQFLVVDILDLDEKTYLIVLPIQEGEVEEEEAIALCMKDKDAGDLVVVEDDETLDKINAYLQSELTAEGAAEAE